jgi:hypothetical protein
MLEESALWNRAKTVLATMILITVSLTVYFSIYLETYAAAPTPSEAGKTASLMYCGPIPGQEVSLDQAQASVGFKISLPASLGNFAELKLLQPPQTLPGCETLYIIYANSKPSSDATESDVADQNGIILEENHNIMTMQASVQNILAAINSTKFQGVDGLQKVTINGYVGCAGGNLDVHEVSWYTETTEYHLIASINYPLEQLVAIAQSIPVN